MLNRSRALALSLAVALAPIVACSSEEAPTRWATTENTNVAIDWDKVNEAYKLAEGPEDLERRINEIYKGDEVVSISVKDESDKTQVVTGFFDKDSSGNVTPGEEIFTIKREVVGEGQAQMSTQGYGAYAGYHSPILSIMTGMMLGSMMSNMFSPGYRPMYVQGYNTSPGRAADLRGSRTPRAGRSAPSGSGRAYPARAGGKSGGGGGMKSGGRFGVRGARRAGTPARLVG